MRRYAPFIILAVAVVYGSSLWSDFMVVDDQRHLTANLLMQTPGLHSLWEFWRRPYFYLYIPLTYSVWQMVAAVSWLVYGRLAPFPFHLLNLSLHAINAVLVFALIRAALNCVAPDTRASRMEQTAQPRDQAAFLGALLFAVHPMQAESTAWISCLKDLLSFSMTALTGLLYWRYTASPPENADSTRVAWPWYGAATLSFVLAMLVKPTAVVIPLGLAVVNRLLLGRRGMDTLRGLIPWFALGGGLTALTKHLQPDTWLAFVAPYWLRPLLAGDTLAFYLLKLLLPCPLMPDYGRHPQEAMAAPLFYAAWLVPLVIGIWLWRAGRVQPLYRVGAAVFTVGLLPVLGLVPFEYQNISTVADRYLYLPMMGVALVVAARAAGGMQRKPRSLLPTYAWLLVLACLAFMQTLRWRDSITLLEYNVAQNPKSYLAYFGLGCAYHELGRREAALRAMLKSYEIRPNSISSAQAIGDELVYLGRKQEAIRLYEHVTPQAEKDPSISDKKSYADLRNNYAVLLLESGKTNEAVVLLRRTLELFPDSPKARRILDRVLAGP